MWRILVRCGKDVSAETSQLNGGSFGEQPFVHLLDGWLLTAISGRLRSVLFQHIGISEDLLAVPKEC